MSLIIIDGPEKAGKTTLAKAMMKRDPRLGYRHWSESNLEVYAEAVAEDVRRAKPVIWDRGWPSAHVYDSLLVDRHNSWWHREPWDLEWFFTRPMLTNGIHIILTGANVGVLKARRAAEPDSGDLPVSPAEERAAFYAYGDTWGWEIHSEFSPTEIDRLLVRAWRLQAQADTQLLPRWTGPIDAPVVFLGEDGPCPPHHIPFCGEYSSQYGRLLGPLAMKCAWATLDADARWLRGRTIIAMGQEAITHCYRLSLHSIPVPHPHWLYRWNKDDVIRMTAESTILNTIKEQFHV
jgi:hypothetical protein